MNNFDDEYTKNRSREVRRKHKIRMKNKAKKIRPWAKDGTLGDHLADCSCASCGNPRKYLGEKTRQEIKAELNHLDIEVD